MALLCLVGDGGLWAQTTPRLTGTAVLERLDTVGKALSAQAQTRGDSTLTAAAQRMTGMASSLRSALGSDAERAVETMDDKRKAEALRAYAATERAQAYLDAGTTCRGSAATAMVDSLALAVETLAGAPASSGPAQPVIQSVETTAHQPLFVLRAGMDTTSFALTGINLSDPQCPDTQLHFTDRQGAAAGGALTIAQISPVRIDVNLAGAAALKPGGYLVHVIPQRKAFLVGCTKQPEAVAAIQVAAPLRIGVDYSVTCRTSARELPLGSGSMPAITSYGQTVSQTISTTACTEPVGYTISATATFNDGGKAEARSITQSADASITTGLSGGLTLSWNPLMQQLLVRSDAHSCKGV